MGAELYRDHTVYRDTVDECARILRPVLGADLRTALFEGAAARRHLRVPRTRCHRVRAGPHAHGVGRAPGRVIGHSLGEYTAACLAGVIDLADMLPLSPKRIRLIGSAGGATVGVAAPAEEIRPLLDDELSLAAVNGPGACTVATPRRRHPLRGPAHPPRRPFRRLRIPVAAHSHVLDPVLPAYESHLRRVTCAAAHPVRHQRHRHLGHRRPGHLRAALDRPHPRHRAVADGITALWDRLHPVS
ncbi:hypothetical protein GCM10023238_30060 [Streptomyces heliomycini]